MGGDHGIFGVGPDCRLVGGNLRLGLGVEIQAARFVTKDAGVIEQFVNRFVLVETARVVTAPLAGMILVIQVGIGVEVGGLGVDVDQIRPTLRGGTTGDHIRPEHWCHVQGDVEFFQPFQE